MKRPGRKPTDGSGLIVAVLARTDQMGGAERSTIELAAADASRGGLWLILARHTGEGQIGALCAELGVPFRAVTGARETARVVRGESATAVWAFGLRWSASLRILRSVGLFGTRTSRPLLLAAQRGLDTWRRPWHNWLDRYTQCLVDVYVSNSVAAADMLVTKVGIRSERVRVVRSGLSMTWFAHPRVDVGLPTGFARVIIVGNDRAEKGHDDAFRILGQLTQLQWALTIYTSESLSFPSRLREAGIAPRSTIIVGHQLTVDDYDRADILLHASRAESFPRAVLEATARGLQVVASDVGDTAAVVPRECLFVPGDIAGGALALSRAFAAAVARPPLPGPGSIKTQEDVADEIRAVVTAAAVASGRR